MTTRGENPKSIDDYEALLMPTVSVLVDMVNHVRTLPDFSVHSIFNDEGRGTIAVDKRTVQGVHDEEGAVGSMVGMVVANALGKSLDGMRWDYDGEYKTHTCVNGFEQGYSNKKPGQWDEAGSLGLCLADSLIVKNGDFDSCDFMQRIIAWRYAGYNSPIRFDPTKRSTDLKPYKVDEMVQISIDAVVKGSSSTREKDSGSVALARNAAIPICFHDNVKLAGEMAAQQSQVTHKGKEVADCCKLLTQIVIMLLQARKNKETTLREVLDNVGFTFRDTFPDAEKSVVHLACSQAEEKFRGVKDENKNWNWKAERCIPSEKRISSDFGSNAMDAMTIALHVLYKTSSFKQAVLKAVNMRGRCCFFSAIVGQMAGAWYGIKGIPEEWLSTVNKWDHGEIALRGYMLSRISQGLSYVVKPPSRANPVRESVPKKDPEDDIKAIFQEMKQNIRRLYLTMEKMYAPEDVAKNLQKMCEKCIMDCERSESSEKSQPSSKGAVTIPVFDHDPVTTGQQQVPMEVESLSEIQQTGHDSGNEGSRNNATLGSANSASQVSVEQDVELRLDSDSSMSLPATDLSDTVQDCPDSDQSYKLIQFESLLEWPEKQQKKNAVLQTSPLLQALRSGKRYELQEAGMVSIFDIPRGTVEDDRNTILTVLSGGVESEAFHSDKDRSLYMGAMGCMVGMAVADAMGARFEFSPFIYKGVQGRDRLVDMGSGNAGKFLLKPGQWTDDSAMGLCLADSLLMNNGELLPHDLMHRFLSWWYLGYNNAFRFDDWRMNRGSVGLGGNISLSFEAYIARASPFTKAGDKQTSGNGSVMRNAAIPICFYGDVKKACEMAAQQSRVTHQGDEAADCCRLLTFIVINLLKYRRSKKHTLQEILDVIGEHFCREFPDCVQSVKYLAMSRQQKDTWGRVDPNRNWNWKAAVYQYSPSRSEKQPGYFGSYAMDAMALALHTLYRTKTFEEAILRVVNMRGDSDSVGAVLGQMAGAWYGIESIPRKWIEVLNEWDHGEFALRGYMLSRIRSGKSFLIKPTTVSPAVASEVTRPTEAVSTGKRNQEREKPGSAVRTATIYHESSGRTQNPSRVVVYDDYPLGTSTACNGGGWYNIRY